MFGRKRSRPPKDWFTCPTCGAVVTVGSLACKECGADETTGWSDATLYDDLDLPEPETPDVPDTFEDFERLTSGRSRRSAWIGLALLALAIVLIIANAVLVGFFN